MLLHDNPFRRFAQSLLQLKRMQAAVTELGTDAQVSSNFIFFSLWLSQQQLRLQPNWAENFPQFINWNRDYTQQLQRQQEELKQLAPRSDQNEQGPLHQMQKLISQAHSLAEQQEQAILYYFYQQKVGLIACEDRQAALLENLSVCLIKAEKIEDAALQSLLEVYLDEEEVVASFSVRLREVLAQRSLRLAKAATPEDAQ